MRVVLKSYFAKAKIDLPSTLLCTLFHHPSAHLDGVCPTCTHHMMAYKYDRFVASNRTFAAISGSQSQSPCSKYILCIIGSALLCSIFWGLQFRAETLPFSLRLQVGERASVSAPHRFAAEFGSLARGYSNKVMAVKAKETGEGNRQEYEGSFVFCFNRLSESFPVSDFIDVAPPRAPGERRDELKSISSRVLSVKGCRGNWVR